MSYKRAETHIGHDASDGMTEAIVASLPGVFYLFRASDGVMLHWNRNLEQRTGRSAKAIAAAHPLDLIAESDRSTVADSIEETIARGHGACEARLLAADGEGLPHYFKGRAVTIDDTPCICGLGIDVSVRLDAQAEARSVHERLVDAVEAMPDGFAHFDAHDCLSLCNERYRELLSAAGDVIGPGRSYTEIMRRAALQGLYPDAGERVEEWLEAHQRHRREHPHRPVELRLATGHWIRQEAHPTRDGGQVIILTDITVYKLRESRLRESEQRYEALFNNDSDAIVISDADSGRILDANHRASSLLGYEHSELVGMQRSELHPPVRRREAESAFMARRQWPDATPFRQYVHHADGEIIPVEISATVVSDDAHGRRLIQCILRDITEREQAERMSADRARILESIARRAPLAQILGQIARMLEHLGVARRARILMTDGDGHLRTGPGFPTLGSASSLPASTETGAGREESGVSLPPDIARQLGIPDRAGETRAVPLHDGNASMLGLLIMQAPCGTRRVGSMRSSIVSEASRLAAIAIEQQHLADRLAWQAGHDDLTELPNRTLLMDRLGQAMARASRYGHSMAVMLLDLDTFKTVNDSLGHDAGDRLLRIVADRLFACLRNEDTVARLGGDEFVVVLPTAGPDDASDVAGKILRHISEPTELDGTPVRTSASIGMSIYPRDCRSPQELLQCADAAMYTAKKAGRDQYRFHEGP